MKTFIKVIEIWIPDRERTRLVFGSGLYGALDDFKIASEKQHFTYDEGLPGKAWAKGHPIVLTKFEQSYFKRTEAAQDAGLTCGIAMPVFAGDFLLAVVVFLCGDDEEHAGSIEVWRQSSEGNDKLQVVDGYYGTLQNFERVSRNTKMAKGQGIPGRAWQSGIPVLLEDIGKWSELSQSPGKQQAAISTGLGIPLIHSDGTVHVITFLSARTTPIAKRIQIWTLDDERRQLTCQQGYSKNGNNLAEMFECLSVKKGEGALGRVWLTGMPMISGNQSIQYNPDLDSLSSMLSIPVIEQGRLNAIVTFLF